MPIVVTTPTSGEKFGPGFTIIAQTTTTGPFATDSIWGFELTAPANEEVLVSKGVASNNSSITTLMTFAIPSAHQMTEARSEWVTGKSGQLRVTFSSASTSFLETTDVAIVLDREAGQNIELGAWMQGRFAGSGQGLSEEEHNAVLQTNTGVIAMAGIDPISLIGDLANAFRTNPPLAFGSMSSVYDLVGDGEMPDVGDLLHTKLGIYFVADIPTNLSHKHGQSEEYPARLIQWRTVHEVGGIQLVTEVVDFITHGELWKWSTAKPLRIEYSVLPNVVVHAQWWQFP